MNAARDARTTTNQRRGTLIAKIIAYEFSCLTCGHICVRGRCQVE